LFEEVGFTAIPLCHNLSRCIFSYQPWS